MSYELKMPKLGESVTEGTIGKWLKKLNPDAVPRQAANSGIPQDPNGCSIIIAACS